MSDAVWNNAFEAVNIVSVRIVTRRVTLKRRLGNRRNSFNTKCVTFVELTDDNANKGYGEVSAMPEGLYFGPSEDATLKILQEHSNRLEGTHVSVSQLDNVLGPLAVNCFARAGIEAAVWHLLAQTNQTTLWRLWCGNRTHLDFSVHVPAADSDSGVVEYLSRMKRIGASRVRLKVRPGADVNVIKAVLDCGLEIAVDCNGAYDPDSHEDLETLKKMAGLGVAVIEQPFDHERSDALEQSSALATELDTQICLDESISSLDKAREAISTRACQVLNIKPSRIGGFLNAIEMAQLAADSGVGVWCGGLYETDLGRAMNLNLMTRVEFDQPGDGDPASLNYEFSTTTDRVVPIDGAYRLNDHSALGGWEPDMTALEQI